MIISTIKKRVSLSLSLTHIADSFVFVYTSILFTLFKLAVDCSKSPRRLETLVGMGERWCRWWLRRNRGLPLLIELFEPRIPWRLIEAVRTIGIPRSPESTTVVSREGEKKKNRFKCEQNKNTRSYITINHRLCRFDNSIWHLIVMIISDISLECLSMSAKRW